jgi:uncharacterized repeat protein (TIGR03803 family)
MTRYKRWTAMSEPLVAATVMLIVTLVLASGAAASEYKILHTFAWAKNPMGNLILDAAGNLYGTTYDGGGHNLGTVFKLKPNPDGPYWTVSILHSFTGTDGGHPYAGVILDAAGNLYGTTAAGGAYDAGTVFEVSPTAGGGWTEKILHNFPQPVNSLLNNGTDGSYPGAGVIFDAAGNLYGTTPVGGNGGGPGGICTFPEEEVCGVVFELSPTASGGWTEKILLNFNGGNGGYPYGGLIFDAAGNLYGTTLYGNFCPGNEIGCGVVFELSPTAAGYGTKRCCMTFPPPPQTGFSRMPA